MKKTLKKHDLVGIDKIHLFLRNSEQSMSESVLMDEILRGNFPAVKDKSGVSWRADSRQVSAWIKAMDAPKELVVRDRPGLVLQGMAEICEEFAVSSLDVLDWHRKRSKNGCPVEKDEKSQTFFVDFDKMEKWNVARLETLSNAV